MPKLCRPVPDGVQILCVSFLMVNSSDRSGRMEYDSLHKLAVEVSAADVNLSLKTRGLYNEPQGAAVDPDVRRDPSDD